MCIMGVVKWTWYDFCRVADAPWRMPSNLEDMKAFFNYDLNPYKWREYCKRVEQYRLQYTMQVL